ncbi:MAG: hypothetical protein A2W98_14800 [Bacteroidetes bacterium GWF2_33_38]|nr:MAG: hypothetical protein A2W98_14800 [Bacteroidetes bacterium GWF2_33_38]OFY75760.1 MAG: hypothetical protein A2265_09955 [Bacteroidetes bacterium RIFOXYA12_FULL_33_9]OFY91322.1 MAG: hypothetical protein A2236_13700 [Bacteroidetes bacterium RIFOXYA2_FULL_33_7]
MENIIKFGVLKETKNPPDRRVAVTPEQCIEIQNRFPNVEIFIQRSELRCFKDHEYENLGLKLVDSLEHCDVLIGVKEVSIPTLIEGKTYIFFSHTAKKQSYNRKLLQEILTKKITLLDYEYFTDINKNRLVAFGKWAGIVGSYNALIAYGKRNKLFELKRAKDCFDFNELKQHVTEINLPAIKILISGGGRVAKGAMETLSLLNLKKVSPSDFLTKTFNEPVICQIDADVYTKRKDGSAFDFQHFFKNPRMYESSFKPYTKVADIYIAAHFWDNNSPAFITKQDYIETDFNIKIIADVSCDIIDPIASTLRPSTIAEPFYGYNSATGSEGDAWDDNNITVMSIDNLPGELPRNASVEFGTGLIEKVYPSLFGEDTNGIIERATIAKNGKLGNHFVYLQNFVDEKEYK